MNVKLIAPFSILATVAIALAANDASIFLASLSGVGKGKVAWKVRDRNNQPEAELTAEAQGLPRQTPMLILIGNNAPINVTTNEFGNLRFAQRYVTTARPTIASGMPVIISGVTGRVYQTGITQQTQ